MVSRAVEWSSTKATNTPIRPDRLASDMVQPIALATRACNPTTLSCCFSSQHVATCTKYAMQCKYMQSNVVVQLPNGVGEEAEDSGSDVKTRERHGETEFSQHRFTSSRWWPLGCLQYSRLHLTSCRAAVDVAQPAVSNEIQDLSIFANQHQCLVQD